MTTSTNCTSTYTAVTTKEDIARFAQTIARAFAEDYFSRHLKLGSESRPDHPKLTAPDAHQNWIEYWEKPINARVEAGGALAQSCDFAAVALW
jgi:hypothetical protein